LTNQRKNNNIYRGAKWFLLLFNLIQIKPESHCKASIHLWKCISIYCQFSPMSMLNKF